MNEIKKLIALVLTVSMAISLFAFPMPSFAAEKKAEKVEDYAIFKGENRKEATEVFTSVQVDLKTTKNSKFSAKWEHDGASNISVTGAPKDFTPYTELKLVVYASEKTTSFLGFYTNNPETDGSDYYGRILTFEKGWNELSLDLNSFGKSREPDWGNITTVSFSSVGWAQEPVAGAVLYIDYMALSFNESFKSLIPPPPTPTPTPAPEGEAGEARYYEEDFEKSEKVNTKSQKDNKIYRAEKDGNHYMVIEKVGTSDVHVDTSISQAGRYVVIQADYASTKFPVGTQAITCKSSVSQHTFVSITGNGEIKAGSTLVGMLKENGTFTNIAIAGDFGNSVYDVYIDGKLAAENLPIGKGAFGHPIMYRVHLSPSTADAGANIMIDNVKVFDGKCPDDFKNTLSAEESAQKKLAETIGSDSPIIDNGKPLAQYLDQIRAVALNVRSGYIYSKGEKYIPDAPAYIKDGRTLLPVRAVSEALDCTVGWDAETKTVTINDSAKITIGSDKMILPDGSEYTLDVPAEITADRTFIPLRALCEQVLGKKVFWDDRGLIVLSNGDFEISPAQVISLNNYMLYDRPQAEELKELFNSVNGNTHPRVVLSKADFDRILSEYQTNEYMKAWGESIIKTARQRLASKHETYVIPDGLRLLQTSRNTLSKSLYIAMAYKLTGEQAFKDYLWEEMQAVCNFVDWNHKLHYLDTGEMTTAVAIAYDWLYHDWSEEQRKFMEEAIYKHSLTWTQKAMYGIADYNHFFVTANTNWNAVCNGGVGVGCIAVFDKYPDLCADILEKNYISIEKMMAEFYPDGAWYEGPTYWEYLMQYLAFFLSTSNVAFGSDFNISKAPGFEKTGQYYLNCDGMSGSNNFHDASVSRLMTSYLMWYSKHMNQPALAEALLYKYNTYSSNPGVYAFMYYDTNVKPAQTLDLPYDSYFGGTEIASLRSSWTDDKGIYASFHSGQNNVNHSHLDAGTFVLDIGGQRFACDIGGEDYNLPGYFGGSSGIKRFDYYRARPEGHNTFVINPDSSFGQVDTAIDKFIAFETRPRGGFAITDLTNSYKPYADSAKRGIMLADERRSVVIRDEIRGMKNEENEVYWFMQLQATNVEIQDKNTVILTKGGVRAKMQIASDATDWTVEVGDSKPLATSPNPPGQNANSGFSRLIIKFKTGKDVNINVKMSQMYDPLGDTPIVETPLDQWSVQEGSATIPSGEIPKFPVAENIAINGEKMLTFDPNTMAIKYVLPYGVTEVESIVPVIAEDVEVSEVILPETLPGEAILKIRNKNDTRLVTTYSINIRIANDTELETSGAQDGNPGENCLDGDLTTRWAVDGESWGIFRFGHAKTISSVWVATWKAKERQLVFDIEVSEDGKTFTKVWSGKTQIEKDELEEFKIPQGTYKAVKLVLHGTTTGTWNSLLEVEFK